MYGPINGNSWAEDAEQLLSIVEPMLYRCVADRMLAHSQAAEDHGSNEDSVFAFMCAANVIREWADETKQEVGR